MPTSWKAQPLTPCPHRSLQTATPRLPIGAGEPGAGHPHPTPLCTTARPCEGAGAPWEGQAGSTCDEARGGASGCRPTAATLPHCPPLLLSRKQQGCTTELGRGDNAITGWEAVHLGSLMKRRRPPPRRRRFNERGCHRRRQHQQHLAAIEQNSITNSRGFC